MSLFIASALIVAPAASAAQPSQVVRATARIVSGARIGETRAPPAALRTIRDPATGATLWLLEFQ